MPEPAKTSPAEDLLRQTITVTDGGDSYEFRIPTLHDEIRIGARIKALSKAGDPDWDGYSFGYDGATQYTLRCCATFETLLQKSSVDWPWTKAADGSPLVDSSKFPIDKVATATRVYQGFTDALTTFRQGGAPDKGTAG